MALEVKKLWGGKKVVNVFGYFKTKKYKKKKLRLPLRVKPWRRGG